MQVIRLSRRNKARTIFEKVAELILATRLDLHYDKDEILSLYVSHAPFGGNVVGLEAASWRYFGTDASDLSWAQAAMLAVLPNSPALVHPGKNRMALLQKRNRLLKKLFSEKQIDEFTLSLALEEPIPDEPFPLPRHARHLLLRMRKDGLHQKNLTSTIDYRLQQQVEQVMDTHHQRLAGNHIMNAAAIVIDVESGNVLAYAGNINRPGFHESEVDVISSPRSTGSILKPFLFAAMMDEGKLLPTMLLPDVPMQINGFSPKNFSHGYDGAVPADQSLIRSLNVPAVHLLRDYRYEKFHSLLKNMGMTTLRHAPDHYGLSLILGGAEGTLWDIAGMYASMARTAENYFEHPGQNRYNKSDFHAPGYLVVEGNKEEETLSGNSWISASSAFVTFNILKELYRPAEESGWRQFSSSRKVAWKTGTSFGFRDGWAIGVTPSHVVGVWVGNADGEGRPGLTGTDAAAPFMFDIISSLPANDWFEMPRAEMQQIAVCSNSGLRVSENCDRQDTIWVTKSSLGAQKCFYHKKIHLTTDRRFQIHDRCASLNEMIHANWFVLPPVQELFFRQINVSYKSLPPFRSDCAGLTSQVAMQMVYPEQNAKVFIPRELNGDPGSSVFELAHRNPASMVFWHLDGKFLGATQKIHHIELNPPAGKHLLTAIDEQGEMIERLFEVISDR
jgi:penicillin-binding protein 1C